MNRNYCEADAFYIRMGREMDGVLYTPKGSVRDTAVVVIHSDADYLNFTAGPNLARRGFLTLCANVERPADPLEQRLPSVKLAVETVKAADGVMLIDSNFGNGMMTLVSLDPAIIDETDGIKRDPAYNVFAREAGYSKDGNVRYTEKFKTRYYEAQAKRQERLISCALERMDALERCEGLYEDDEPLTVAGGSQIAPNNRLFPQDLHMLAHTKGEYDLVHADGSVTREVIRSVRTARPAIDPTPLYGLGAMTTTVRTYLSSNCVRTTPDYGVKEDGIDGIDYDSAFCCPPGNVKHIHAPLLVMGMTGGYECIASEIIYQNAVSADKTIAFVEGGTHMLGTAKDAERYPGQFGDAAKTLFDAIADWLNAKFPEANGGGRQ